MHSRNSQNNDQCAKSKGIQLILDGVFSLEKKNSGIWTQLLVWVAESESVSVKFRIALQTVLLGLHPQHASNTLAQDGNAASSGNT